MSDLLSLIILLPIIGVFFIYTIHGKEEAVSRNACHVALLTTVVVFLLSFGLWIEFNPLVSGFQFVEKLSWIHWGEKNPDISYYIGVDGISVLFVLLTSFLSLLATLTGCRSKKRAKTYMICLLALETMIMGVFCSLDAVLFYMFFEGMLIPLYFLIGIFGEHTQAARRSFLYIMTGSAMLLLTILTACFYAGTTEIPKLFLAEFPVHMQYWLWAAAFFAFAVRAPLFPLHSWYINVIAETPVAVTLLFTGVILKTGAYGLLRFVVPMFPEASACFSPYVYGLLVAAIFYVSFVALIQDDIKKLILYLLSAHMSLVVIGLFSSEQQSVEGAVFHLISLGITCSALFLCLNMMHKRTGSSKISDIGGLLHSKPRFSVLFVLLLLSFIGFPSTSGFVGEFMILCGIFKHSIITAVLVSAGMFFVVSAMAVLYHRVFTGSYKNIEKASDIWEISDISGKESFLLLLMIGIVLFMGLYPQPFLDVIHSSVSGMRGAVNVI